MFKTTKLSIIITAIIMLVTFTFLSGCSSESEKYDVPVNKGDFLLPNEAGTDLTGNEYVSVDTSNSNDGYVLIKYTGSSQKVKLQIKKDSETYTYDLYASDDYLVFPLSCGNGSYTLEVYENVSGNQYAQVYAESAEVTLSDENKPFLYPNYYVDYDIDDNVVGLTMKVTESCETQLEVVDSVFNYVIENIKYDYDLAANPPTGYIPQLDRIIDEKNGICFDYASLMSAMLRIRNIPAKLVVGYSGKLYHAWISVYITDVGWVSDIIEFDGKNWTLMDPTFASSEGMTKNAEYIKNKDKYHALYFY